MEKNIRNPFNSVVEVMRRVQDEMLEQPRLFCPDLNITTYQLDHLAYASEKDVGSGLGSEEPRDNV